MVWLESRLFGRANAPWIAGTLVLLVSTIAIVNRRIQSVASDSQFVLPVLPTAVLSEGDSSTLPQRFTTLVGQRFAPFYRTTGARILGALLPDAPLVNPSATLAGSFDLAFVATDLYPLIILTITCNIVNADREAGVLLLVLAQRIPFRRWVATRALVRGSFLFLFLVLVPAMVVAWIVSGSWFHLAIWVVALTAYCAFWFTVSIVISVRTASAPSGFVIGASTWLGLAVVVPSLVNLSAPFIRLSRLDDIVRDRGTRRQSRHQRTN